MAEARLVGNLFELEKLQRQVEEQAHGYGAGLGLYGFRASALRDLDPPSPPMVSSPLLAQEPTASTNHMNHGWGYHVGGKGLVGLN